MRTLIKNGTIVSAADETVGDVLLSDERIAAIAAPGMHDWDSSVDRIVDADGKLVIPGGIDVHTHMELPFGGTLTSDSFETGTRAAAWGGTTTIIDFAVQTRGGGVLQALDQWMSRAAGSCAIDFGLHVILTDVNSSSLQEMSAAVDAGITSFKLFMAYPGVFYSDDGAILRAMNRATDVGATIMIHAENGIAIDVLVAEALDRGEHEPMYHGIVRKSSLEGEAVHRAIQLSRVAGCPLYIVHMSAREAVGEVATARENGLPVFAETCPQYLVLGLDKLGNGFEGAKYVCSPPLRDESEGHQRALWAGLAGGSIQVVSTDHSPFTFEDDPELGRQKRLGEGDFSKIPNGIPGVEHRLELLYSEGVVGGRLSANRWVDLCSTSPAKLFGLYPRKGTISVGADADIVVFDPRKRHVLSAATHHMHVDYSCYEGMHVQGKVDSVWSRGRLIVESDRYLGQAGNGVFLRRLETATMR